MIIRQMTGNDRNAAAFLWRFIFEDSEPFTRWFFEKRFCPEHSFAAFDEDRMIAMTLGRPTRIAAEGTTFGALLISGVSTLPAYRGQGLMHTLVSAQIAQAKESGFSCCYLHPVSESLYASLGFRNGTDALLIESDPERRQQRFSIRAGENLPAMRRIYDTLLQTHDGMQIRDDEEIRLLLQDYATDGSHMLTAYEGRSPKGYLIFLDDGTVSELFALCPEAYTALLDEAAIRAGRSLKAIVPVDCGAAGTRVYSMQYLVFNDAFHLPLKNGFCRLSY